MTILSRRKYVSVFGGVSFGLSGEESNVTLTRWTVNEREYAFDVRDERDDLVCSISKDYDHAKTYAAQIVREHNSIQETELMVEALEVINKAQKNALEAAKGALVAIAKLTRFELPELHNTDQWKRNLIDIDGIANAVLAMLDGKEGAK